ncbi:putative ssDNA binding protein [Saccharata proteae CBS 121410]|uniref:SsDNA binding protein n=1 Tax=Saccharata proteae CBS 121410 TaxID=1314787 RepID=A0A9P4HX20_9PEZI|nr:putative ssDNA binding protein [Saccharata proteae CBS 121410]
MASLRSFRALPALSRPFARSFSSTPRAALAKMQVIGRLAAEPEVVQTTTGRELVKYALGTSSGPRDNRKTSWFNVACFDEGPRKDFLLRLPKGTLLHVDADASMSQFETEDGKRTSRLNLVQRSIEVLSRPATEESNRSAAEEPDSGIGHS